MSDSPHLRCDQDVVHLCRLAQVLGDRHQPACILLCTPEVTAFTVCSSQGNQPLPIVGPSTPSLPARNFRSLVARFWGKVSPWLGSLRSRPLASPEPLANPAARPTMHSFTPLMLSEITTSAGEHPVHLELNDFDDSESHVASEGSPAAKLSAADQEWLDTVGQFSRRHGERWVVEPEDLAPFWPLAQTFTRRYSSYSGLILTHGPAAVPVLLAAMKPYVPVESGATVALLESDTPLGRLLAMAYREAPACFATNQPALDALSRLRPRGLHLVPTLIDEEVWHPLTEAERERLRARFGIGQIILSLEPHDWARNGNDRLLRAFARLVRDMGEGDTPRLVIALSGKDADRSRALARDLRIADHLTWLALEDTEKLHQLVQICHVFVDRLAEQDTLEPFALKVAACGVPIVGVYDLERLGRGYPEAPPVVKVESDDDLVAALTALLAGTATAPAGERLASWFQAHHSRTALANRLPGICHHLLHQRAENHTGFESLHQKLLELHYEAASVDSYDDKYHHGAAYQVMDQKLVDIIRQSLARSNVVNPQVLDLGCGPGSLVRRLQQIPGIRLTGVDLSPEMIRYARERYPEVTFQVGDTESLGFADGTFDAVLCSGMLHHLPSLALALPEIRRVLKPGGILIAREPNEDNFAARQPELAFAHLCMRHYLFYGQGIAPIVEPEAHEYHRSFTFTGLVNEVSPHLQVEAFHTDMMVSYFYDEIFSNSSHCQQLADMDATLTGQPGLNVIVVARKGPAAGVAPEVAEYLRTITPIGPVSFEHYSALAAFAGQMFAQHRGDFYAGLTQARPLHRGSLAPLLRPGRSVLVAGDHARSLRLVLEEVQTLAQPNGMGPDAFTLATMDQLGEPLRKRFDIGVLVVQKPMPAVEFVRLIDCVRDYGLIYLELGSDARIHGMQNRERGYLQTLPLLNTSPPGPDGRVRACLSRYLYSNWDFYQALSVALEIEMKRASASEKARLSELLINSRTLQLEYEYQFSNLRRLARQQNLAELLRGGPLLAKSRGWVERPSPRVAG